MLRKLVKIFTTLVLLVLSAYLLFPWWAGWLIGLNLPSNISLQSFKSEYPGLKSISIEELSINIDGTNIALYDFKLKYDFSKIAIKEVTIQLPASGSDNFDLNSIKLPPFPFEQFDILEPVKLINIGQLTLESSDKSYIFSSIKMEQKTKKLFNISAEKILFDNNIDGMESLNLNASLHLDVTGKTAQLILAASRQQLFVLEFNDSGKEVNVDMLVDLKAFQNSLPNLLPGLPAEPSEKMSIRWNQDNIKEQTEIVINSRWLLSNNIVSELKEQGIELQLNGFNTFNKQLELPIELTILSNIKKQQLNAEVSLTSHFVQTLELSTQQGLLNISPIELKFNSSFELFDDSLQQKSIRLSQSHISISSPKIIYQTQNKDFDLNASKLVFSGNIAELQSDLKEIRNVDWALKGKITSPNVISNYQNETAEINSDLVGHFEINQLNANNVSSSASSGKMVLSGLTILTEDIKLTGDMSIDWNNIDLDLSKGNLSFELNTYDNQISDIGFDSLISEATISISEKDIKGEIQLLVNQQPLAPSVFVFNRISGNTSLELTKNVISQQLINHFLGAVGKQNEIPLEVVSGELEHSGDFKFNQQLDLLSQFSIKNMLFKFGENEIQGLNISQITTSLEPLEFTTSLSIDKVDLSSGLEINHIVASMVAKSDNENKDVIELKDIKAELLEGQLEAKSIRFSDGEILLSEVQLKQLSLTELIFFMDINGLYAEGEINLTLPIATESGDFIVENGSFQSIGEGIIKYSSGSVESPEEENIAIRALQNFHYKSLDGTLSYNNEGAYHIKLHLLGSNPEVYSGYPIDFVLNLNGELSGVFRSLFLTGNFEEAVMQQVKSDQLKTNEND